MENNDRLEVQVESYCNALARNRHPNIAVSVYVNPSLPINHIVAKKL